MHEKLFTSCNLCSIPFLGECDSTRLQMSSKQLVQALTHSNCEVPRVIGSNYQYLTNTSTMFRLVAPENGKVSYVNDDIMIVIYNTIPETITSYDVFPIKMCASLYGSKLRYKRDVGNFKTGDVLYEYDSFKSGLPTYGYNTWTAYVPFFGLNHEDAVVVSESFVNKLKCTKIENVIIPIYTYSLFKNIYPDSPFEFLPDIGQSIQENIIAYKCSPKSSKDAITLLKSMNLSDFSSILNNELQFTTSPLTSRIHNGKVVDIKVHKLNNIGLIDRRIQKAVDLMHNNYFDTVDDICKDIYNLHGLEYTNLMIIKHYILNKTSVNRMKYNLRYLTHIIELKISKENHTHLGDKVANRYAHKGVISCILPDELRPIAVHSKKPIDMLVGPISVASRMNFGQIVEGNIAKVVTRVEEDILRDPSSAADNIKKLAMIAESLEDYEYANKIKVLSNKIRTDPDIHDQFMVSIMDLGLYFEAQNFANFDEQKLHKNIEQLFGTTVNEPMLLKRELLAFLKEKLELNVELPTHDIILNDIYCGPIYYLKLKQESASKLSCRDLGNYKSTTNQPVQGKGKDGAIGQSSRLGHMEFDGLFGHNVPRTISEFRTVKNDNKNLKTELIHQILTTGEYHLPNSFQDSSNTKLIIDGLIEFINN